MNPLTESAHFSLFVRIAARWISWQDFMFRKFIQCNRVSLNITSNMN